MRFNLRTLLILPALACFAAAYRFASHGIGSHDTFCLGLAAIAAAVGVLLSVIAHWNRRARPTATDAEAN
jgi:hypothetical protein